MLNKGFEDYKKFSRRAFMVTGLQGLLLTVMGGRLAWLQITEGHRYKTLADKNRINIKLLVPSRGMIVDRSGQPLAVNVQNFRVVLIPEQTEDIDETLLHLKKLIKLPESRIAKVKDRIKKNAEFLPVEVQDNLQWEEVAKVEVNLPELPGVAIDVGELRNYPAGEAVAHLVGYVGAVSKSEIDGDPLLSLPAFKIGKTSVEKNYDQYLRGKAGSMEVEVNVLGREVRELRKNPSQAGNNIVLSADLDLQAAVQKRLKAERSASAVIMDAKTGALYALVSSPAFDPNLFSKGLSLDMWERLLADPGHPLTNKAVAGQYPPGSTFKVVTALAALEAGVIDKRNRFYCPGYYAYGGDRFHCWKRGGHGSMDLLGALSESCDTYFYKIASETGIDKIAETARRLGLGQKLGFDLKEERPGIMPDKEWKMGHIGQSWRGGDTIIASIGQGYILTTPLQLAVMMARVVNGGFQVKPWLVGYIGNRPQFPEQWPDMGLKAQHMNLVKEGLDQAVNDREGTAFNSRIEQAGFHMGGKTGTAQVRRITQAERKAGIKNEDLPWKYRHHALFVGYAPVSEPRYVVSVIVEHGGGGASTAAPLARDLLLEAKRHRPAEKPMLKGDDLSAGGHVI